MGGLVKSREQELQKLLNFKVTKQKNTLYDDKGRKLKRHSQ